MFLSKKAEEGIAALLADQMVKVNKGHAVTDIKDDVAAILQTNIMQIVDLCGPGVENSFNRIIVRYLTTGIEK